MGTWCCAAPQHFGSGVSWYAEHWSMERSEWIYWNLMEGYTCTVAVILTPSLASKHKGYFKLSTIWTYMGFWVSRRFLKPHLMAWLSKRNGWWGLQDHAHVGLFGPSRKFRRRSLSVASLRGLWRGAVVSSSGPASHSYPGLKGMAVRSGLQSWEWIWLFHHLQHQRPV